MGVKQMGLPLAGIAAASVLPALGLALGWRSAMAIPGLLIVASGAVAALLYRDAVGPGQLSAGRVGARSALKELIHRPDLLVLCSIAFCYLIVQLSLLTYLVLYLAEVALVAAVPEESTRIVAAGGYLAMSQVGGAVGRVSWGVVSDRLFQGRRLVVLAWVGAGSALMLAVLGTLGAACPLWLLAAVVFACGATAVSWNGVYAALITERVGQKYAGTGVGMSMTLTEVGTIVGPPAFGLVVDVAHSFQTAWLLLGCVAALGTLIAIAMSKGEQRAVSGTQ